MVVNKLKSFIGKLVNTGFFHIFASNIIINIINFLNGIILVRIVSKEEYGIYTYANNILSFFLLLSGMGLVTGVFQLCSESSQDKNKQLDIYYYGQKIGTFFNLLIAVVILVISQSVKMPMAGVGTLLAISSVIPIFQYSVDLKKIFFRFTIKNKEYAYSGGMESFLLFLFFIIGAFLGGAKGLIIGRYMSLLCISVIMIRLFHAPSLKIRNNIDKKEKKDLYTISLVAMCSNGASQLLYLLDVFILGIVVKDSSIIASYKVATTIPIALEFISSTIVVYVYPHFVEHRNDSKWLKTNFYKLLQIVGIVNMGISVLLFIMAPFILAFLFGEQYIDAIVPFRILAVEYFFKGTFRIISGNLLSALRRFKFNLFNSIFSGVINIIGNVILIPLYGSNGAAISTLIVVLVSGTISTWYITRVISKT